MIQANILFAPEWVMLIACLFLFTITLGDKNERLARITASVFAVLNLVVCLFSLNSSGLLFFAAYEIDLFSQLFKCVIAVGLVVLIFIGGNLKEIKQEVQPEYQLFLFLSALGVMMLVSSIEWITLIVALELSSFPLYIMVAMRRERAEQKAQMESAVKYMMFGVAASAVMLFGLSYLFGLTGTTLIKDSLPKLMALTDQPAAILAIILIMSGFFYKLAVFPFHFWTPDVYQGASNETTAVIASLPKIGAVAVLVRLTALAATQGDTIVPWLTLAAVGSMFYGNLVALVQTDIKRLLGFSGIAHAGYILLGLVALNDSGTSASVYYIIGYLFMISASFLVICTVSIKGANLNISEFAGLHKREPVLAFVLAVALFSLAGLPPFVGFMGKFNLLAEAYRAGHLFLCIVAVINTAIAIYYYVSIVKVAYIDAPTEGAAEPIPTSVGTRTLGVLLCLVILVLGIMPSKALTMIAMAIKPLFG